jgi:hypothetical protein
MFVPHAVIMTPAKSSLSKIETATAWALTGRTLKLPLSPWLLGGC